MDDDGGDDRTARFGRYYRSKSEWHLSRGVPITMFLMIIMQAAALIIWATKLDSRVDWLEKADFNDRTVMERRLSQLESQLPRIAVIESRQNDVIKRLDANAIKLDTLLDRSIAPYQPK